MLELIIKEVSLDIDLAMELFSHGTVCKVLECWVVALRFLHERLSLKSWCLLGFLLEC